MHKIDVFVSSAGQIHEDDRTRLPRRERFAERNCVSTLRDRWHCCRRIQSTMNEPDQWGL